MCRIQLVATAPVIEAAEKCCVHVVNMYSEPNLTIEQISERLRQGKHPLRDFAAASAPNSINLSFGKPIMKFFGGNDPASQKIETLKKIPIFQPLSRKEILEVDALLHERTYEKDEIIFEEGDAGHGIFIIISGKIRVKSSRKLLEVAAPEFGPGDLLGELTLFDEAPRAATAVAIERTVTVALFQAEFSSLMTKNKNIGVKVLFEISKTMSRRFRRLLLEEKSLPSV